MVVVVGGGGCLASSRCLTLVLRHRPDSASPRLQRPEKGKDLRAGREDGASDLGTGSTWQRGAFLVSGWA